MLQLCEVKTLHVSEELKREIIEKGYIPVFICEPCSEEMNDLLSRLRSKKS